MCAAARGLGADDVVQCDRRDQMVYKSYLDACHLLAT